MDGAGGEEEGKQVGVESAAISSETQDHTRPRDGRKGEEGTAPKEPEIGTKFRQK